jgi:hypothetical protein
MSDSYSEQSSIHFYSQTLGWVDKPVSDTTLRLDSSMRTQNNTVVSNTLYQSNPDGGYDIIDAAASQQLSGAQQGLVFTCSPHMLDGQAFVMLRPVKYIDATLIHLLGGLDVFLPDGTLVGNPQMAASCFLLTSEHASDFYQRVAAAGGLTLTQEGDLQEMHRNLTLLGDVAKQLEEICEASRHSIEKLQQGINADVPLISERARAAHGLKKRADELVERITEQAQLLTGEQAELTIAAQAESFVENAQQWAEYISGQHREHRSYEIQARTRLKEEMKPQLAVPELPAAQRRLMMLPLVEYYTHQGFDARIVKDGAVVTLGDIVVELTGAPSARTPHTEQVAQELAGRQTAERTKREL